MVGDGASPPELRSAGPAISPSNYFVGDGASPPELVSAGPAISPSNYVVGGGASAPLRGTTFYRTCHFPEQLHCRGRSVSPHPGNYFLQDLPLPQANTLSGTKRQPPSGELLSAGPATSPSNYFVGDEASAPIRGTTFCRTCHFPEQLLCRGRSVSPPPGNYFLQDLPPPRANTLSRTECWPRNYFLQDLPLPRANTLSGMERHHRNYILQDLPPPRETTLSGTECQISKNTFCRTCHIPEKILCRGRSAPLELLSAGPTTSPRNYFVGDGATPPELFSAGPATSPRKYFVGDGASPPELLTAGPARCSYKRWFVTLNGHELGGHSIDTCSTDARLARARWTHTCSIDTGRHGLD